MREKVGLRKILRYWRAALAVAVLAMVPAAMGVALSNDVWADNEAMNGTNYYGNNTKGQPTSCYTFPHGITVLCGSPLGSGGGGRAWYIYKTENITGDFTGVEPRWTKTILDGYISSKDIKVSCANSEYYAVHGWVGPYQMTLWGPAEVGAGLIGSAAYNFYNPDYENYGKDESGRPAHRNIDSSVADVYELKEAIMNHGLGDHAKLAEGVIDLLRSLMDKVEGEGNGYVCIDRSGFKRDIDFSAQSYASAKGSNSTSAYGTTQVVNEYVQADAGTITIKKGQTATITFSHNLYSNEKYDKDVTWTILHSGNGFTPSVVSVSDPESGTTKFLNKEGAYYVADNRTGTDGSSWYLKRESFERVFNTVGLYTFCEGLSISYDKNGTPVNGEEMTSICVAVQVRDDCGDNDPTCSKQDDKNNNNTADQLCSQWAPASYYMSTDYYGVTSVLTRVYNPQLTEVRRGSYYTGWRGTWDEGTSPQRSVDLDNRITYAMPGDTVKWVSCYYPGVQSVVNTEITVIGGHNSAHGDQRPNFDSNTNDIAHNIFTPWQNQYATSWTSNSGSTLKLNGKYENLNVGRGVTSIQTGGYTNYTINKTNDVGKYFEEWIGSGTPVFVDTTNEGIHTWSCWPYRCWIVDWVEEWDCSYEDEDGYHSETCSTEHGHWDICYETCGHDNDYIRQNDHNMGPVISQRARVEVPYNFRNKTEVGVSSTAGNVVYAGDAIEVSTATVSIGKRQNNVTAGNYATIVRNTTVQLIAYTSNSSSGSVQAGVKSSGGCSLVSYVGNCDVVNSTEGEDLNDTGILNGTTYYRYRGFDGNYAVYDADAGMYMCFVLAMYPYQSGPNNSLVADKTLDAAGDDTWYASAPACKQIAKKPSFQVWGMSMSTSGGIDTNYSTKNYLSGVSGYDRYPGKLGGGGGTIQFGSWAEEAVISNGEIRNFASGAALGKSSSTIYGDTTSDFCKEWTPLTIANTSITGSAIQVCGGDQIAGRANISTSIVDRAALANYWGEGADLGSNNIGRLEWIGRNVTSATGKDIAVVKSGSVSIGGGSISEGMTRVVKADGDIYISGNIIYANGLYYSEADVPQVVLYATGNINIDPGVTRVDAILIAGGTVNTGSGANQLMVNGIVIANKLELQRTYGNTPGAGSGTPAEIFNYDSSALLWGAGMASSEESDTLTVTYQHEVAPRY